MAAIRRPLPVALGLRMAAGVAEGHGAVPTGSAVVGTTVALAATVGALVFGTSLGRLVSTPQRFGQSWEVTESSFGAGVPAYDAARIASSAGHVSGYSGGVFGEVTIAGHVVAAVGIDRLKGDVFPTLLRGRPPRRPDEIVLGATTMRQAHSHVGAQLPVGINGTPMTMRVVGEAIFPEFSRGNFNPTDLGQGAATVGSLFASPSNLDPSAPGYSLLLLRVTRGTDPATASARVLSTIRGLGCPTGACSVTTTLRPAEINDYTRVRETPVVLAAVLGALGTATLAYLLATSTRRRRRELAIFRTLGFEGRQLSAAVAWQASALVIVALIVGIPLGLVMGHWVWMAFADAVGVADDNSIPWVAVAFTIAAALVIANVIGIGPGVAAGRVRPAVALRTE
jgi:hypothetical protein